MKKRLHYTFIGRVQGVGFRFRAYHAAYSLGLTGWVQNEFDGSVSMEVQGEASDIDTMLEMIEKSSYIRIDHLDSKELSPDSDEIFFQIRD